MKLKLLTLSFILLLSSLSIFAQKSNDDKKPKRSNHLDRLKRVLNLSEEQVKKMREVRKRTSKPLQQSRMAFRLARKELDNAIYAENPNEKEISLKIEKLVQAQTKLTRVHALREYEVRKILKPDQLERFLKLRKGFGKKRKKKQHSGQRHRKRKSSPPF